MRDSHLRNKVMQGIFGINPKIQHNGAHTAGITSLYFFNKLFLFK